MQALLNRTGMQTHAFRHPGHHAWRRIAHATCVVAALAIAMPASAVESSADAPAGWQFEIAPYLWMAGMKGDTKAGELPTTRVDMSFGDVFKVLDFALMGTFEARKGRWGFLFDGQYIRVSDSGTSSRAGAGPGGATLTANADLTYEQFMYSGAVAYRVSDGPTRVDVLGGARYMKVDIDAAIDASLFGLPGGGTRTVERRGTKSWIDPYIGVRVQHPIDERWTLVGYLDAGGFGAASDLTLQAIAGVDYAFTKSISGKFGYRYLKVDYERNGVVFDMETYGTYLGAGFRF